MKKVFSILFLITIVSLLFSCKKKEEDEDEGILPSISFKKGNTYVYKDSIIAANSNITIGINAAKTEDFDVLKKFNISKSVNGTTATSVYSKDLTGTEGDNYTYDYSTALENTPGQTNKYTFTITNRDGLVNQVSLTVTIQ